MYRVPKKRKVPTRAPAPQASRFFKLPPELRNAIYEVVAQDEQTLHIDRSGFSYAPSLSRVCQQARSEYESIYKTTGATHATECIIHITDFKRHVTIDALSHLPHIAPGVQCTYKIYFFLTNAWDSTDLSSVMSGALLGVDDGDLPAEGGNVAPYENEIFFDPKGFDVDFVRRALTRVQWTFRLDQHFGDVKKVEIAFQRAFKRYGMRFELATRHGLSDEEQVE